MKPNLIYEFFGFVTDKKNIRRIETGEMAAPKSNVAQYARQYKIKRSEEQNDMQVSKIFQITITALSLLAFGGYLITFVITAVRKNSNAKYSSASVIVLSVKNPLNWVPTCIIIQ